MSASSGVVLLVEPPGGSPVLGRIADVAALAGLEHEVVEVAELGAALARERPHDRAILVAVLAAELGPQLGVARQVHGAAPLVQIVFLAERGRSAELQGDTIVAPLIGNAWSLVDPESDVLSRILIEGARSARQRLRHRTTVQRMNVRLRTPPDVAPPPANLVVSERFLANVLEFADDAIFVIDRHDRIASWNRGASRLFGSSADEVHGAPVDTLVGADHVGRLLALVHAAWGGEAVRHEELECRRFDGERFTVEATLAPILDDAGSTVAVSCIARDVSERRQHEAQVRALNLELEGRLAAEREVNAALSVALEALDAKERELESLQQALDGE